MTENISIPEHELPLWMKQAQRAVDWGALLVIAFSLLAAWSFLFEPNLPATNDIEHYIYQADDISQAFREGLFYPRWSPYAINGYGAPIPHYYPQGAAYLTALINVTFTNDLIAAVRFLYIFAYLLAGGMLYAFVAQRSKSLYGLLAALAYLYNPYIGLTVPHVLGDLPLVLGLALLPSLLWAINRILCREQAIDVLFLAIIIGLIIFVIPKLLPQALFLSLVLLAIHLYQYRSGKRFVWVFASIFLGIGFSAFYWLPALIELEQVTWHAPIIDAASRLATLGDLFSQSSSLDSSLMLYEAHFHLGWGLIGLSILGVIACFIYRKTSSLHLAFFAYAMLNLLLLFLFPNFTELLASICLSLAIAGAYTGRLFETRFGNFLSISSILVLILLAFPTWHIPSPALPIASLDAISQLNYERQGFGIAVLPAGWAIPSVVSPNSASTFADESLANFSRIPFSAGQVSLLEENAYSGMYRVITNQATSLRYYRAYFPNWRANLDGRNLNIEVLDNGLMQIDVPANSNNNLEIYYGTSPIGLFSWGLSALSICLICGLWWLRWRDFSGDFDQSILLNTKQSRNIFFIFIFMAIAHALPLQQVIQSFTNQESLGNANYFPTAIDSRFQFFAYELAQNNLRSGESIHIKLYWQVSRPTLDQYQVRLRLTSAQNAITVLQTSYTHPAYFPTNRWVRGFLVPQAYELVIPSETEAGLYQVFVDIYRCDGICDRGEAEGASPSLSINLAQSIQIN